MPHVASPDDVHSCHCERCRQAGSLRIVKEYDVAGLDEAHHAVSVSVSNPGVVGGLVGTESTPVAGCSVQVIMDSFGYGEELGVPTHDQPMHINSCVERITDKYLEHFGDAPAFGRRADVPDSPPFESLAGYSRGTSEISITFSPDERLQVGQGAARHEDLVDWKFLGWRGAKDQDPILPGGRYSPRTRLDAFESILEGESAWCEGPDGRPRALLLTMINVPGCGPPPVQECPRPAR